MAPNDRMMGTFMSDEEDGQWRTFVEDAAHRLIPKLDHVPNAIVGSRHGEDENDVLCVLS